MKPETRYPQDSRRRTQFGIGNSYSSLHAQAKYLPSGLYTQHLLLVSGL